MAGNTASFRSALSPKLVVGIGASAGGLEARYDTAADLGSAAAQATMRRGESPPVIITRPV